MSPSPPIVVTSYLVVRASGDMRIVKNQPRLGADEVAFRVRVSIPRTWGRVQAAGIELELPEPPEAIVNVGDPMGPHGRARDPWRDDMSTEPERVEWFPEAAAAIAGCPEDQHHIVLLRLAAKLNNGSEHFDHGTPGYSWLCLACARAGGWSGFVSANPVFGLLAADPLTFGVHAPVVVAPGSPEERHDDQ